MISKGIWRGAI